VSWKSAFKEPLPFRKFARQACNQMLILRTYA
jgi:hypothetical protein